MASAECQSVMDWTSQRIPSSIRRPWHVLEEDVVDQLDEAAERASEVDDEKAAAEKKGVLELLASVQNRGAHAAFSSLPGEVRRILLEVSLMELSAYVCWKRAQAAKGGDVCKDYQAAWDILDCDVKVYWVPDDPWVVLAADPTWAPLLDDALLPAKAVRTGWFEYKDPASGIHTIIARPPPPLHGIAP